MSDPNQAVYNFLPYARRGMAAAINTADALGAGIAGHTTLQANLWLNEKQCEHR